MKKRTVGILMGITIAAAALGGCKRNEATEAANESAEIEKEGNGEDAETEAAQEKAEESESSGDSGEAQGEEEEDPPVKVGVLLPREENWSSDGIELKGGLEEKGYEAELVYAADSEEQVSQIAEMAEAEIPALIIAPVDEYGLQEALAQIKEKGIYVFSYDRLIRESDGVNYYTTFSGRSAGRAIGEAMVKEEELDKTRENGESRTIEFLMGSKDNMQDLFFYNGVMEILQPYLDDGTLVCRSGQTSFEDTGILREGRERAEKELGEILEEFYQDTDTPDIICTGYDEAACGAAEVLAENGVAQDEEHWPLITGFGCQAEAVKGIAEGKIFCSVFMDRRTLASECVKMVDTYLKGEKPEVNNYEEYDNGTKIIGTYLCDVQVISEENYESLIDNGYYREDEIRPENSEDEDVEEDTGEEDSEEKDAEENDARDEGLTPDPEGEGKDSRLSVLGEKREKL